MEITDDDIQAFLKGKMEEEDRAAFAAKVASDPKLAERVTLWENILEATLAKGYALTEFRSLSRRIIEEELQSPAKKRLPWYRSSYLNKLIVGVGGILLIGVAGWLINRQLQPTRQPMPVSTDSTEVTSPGVLSPRDTTNKNVPSPETPIELKQAPKAEDSPPSVDKDPPSTSAPIASASSIDYQQLAREQFDEFNTVTGLRSGNTVSETSRQKRAERAYTTGDYEAVINLLPGGPQELDLEAVVLRSHAYFRLKRFDLAAVDFQYIMAKDPFNADPAEWNLLQCYLAQLPETQTRFSEQLEKISSQEFHSFQQQAIALKDTLTVQGREN